MFDSVETENIPCVKSMPKNSKAKIAKQNESKKMPLSNLQPSANSQQILVGKNGIVGLHGGVKKKKNDGTKLKAQDVENVPVVKSKLSKESSLEKNTGATENEAYRLMISETIPSDYWQEVAEQRRLALEVALQENEELHRITSELREENAYLREMAEQAEHLSDILKSLTGENETED